MEEHMKTQRPSKHWEEKNKNVKRESVEEGRRGRGLSGSVIIHTHTHILTHTHKHVVAVVCSRKCHRSTPRSVVLTG